MKPYVKAAAVAMVAILLAAGLYVGLNLDWGDDGREQITVTDMFNRKVEVPTNLTKVVAAGTAALRFVTYLNGSSTIIGVEDFEKDMTPAGLGGRTYAIAHPEFADLKSIGPQFGGDAELMAAANPEVIFYSPRNQQASDCDTLQGQTGIPVVGLSTSIDLSNNIGSFYRQIDLVGKILGTQERAEALKAYIGDLIDDIGSRVEDISAENRPTVFIGGLSYGGNHGLDWTSINYLPFLLLNASNVITTELLSTGTGQISIDEIWKKNPEYVFVDRAGLSLAKTQYDQYKSSLDEVNAFKNGNVYGVLQTNWYASNWDTVLLSCYYVGKVLYPEKFADVEISEKADEIYTMMLGKPIYDKVIENTGGDFGKISLAS